MTKITDQLNTIQNIEYEALIEIKKICDAEDITFFLRGGSVLGSIKYNGFVPWDDDIDIALPRKDYFKLISVMPQYFGDKFQFVSYQHVKNAHCYFPRVLLRDKYRENLQLPQNNERGLVLIDILPLDGMPKNGLNMKIHIIKAYIYRILASLWTIEIKKTVSMHDDKKQKILKILHMTGIQRLYTQDEVYQKLDKLYSRYIFGKTEMAGMLSSSKFQKEIVPYEWWGKGQLGRFREIEVLLPQKADAYLKHLFGDNYANYEPPIECRTKSHIKGTN